MIFKLGCAAIVAGAVLDAMGYKSLSGPVIFAGVMMIGASVVMLIGKFMP